MIKFSDEDMVRGVKLMVENGFTIRKAADMIGVSKSSLHIYIHKELQQVDSFLFDSVSDILAKNLAERHLRGGESTKQKYLAKRAAV